MLILRAKEKLMGYAAERITQTEANRAYSTLLDVKAYRNLLSKKDLFEPEAFRQEFSALENLTRHNVETSIGERFNVELFQETYQIKNNLIFHSSFKEPFIQAARRGQKYRRDNGSVDLKRETAEVLGFEKVQDLLTRPNASLDEKIIVISPHGSKNSIYQHNFFDVYQRGQDGRITMSRLTCKFSHKEFYEAAKLVDALCELPQNPDDADFLCAPLVTYKSFEEIKQIFSPQENTMSRAQFAKLIEACTPLIINFLNNLAQNSQEHTAELDYNRILKFAHIYTGIGPQTYSAFTRRSIIEEIRGPIPLPGVAFAIDRQTFPATKTGCGISGQSPGVSKKLRLFAEKLRLSRPFSVADFSIFGKNSEDDEEVTDFQCPGIKADGTRCTYIVKAYSGITKCPQCGMEATCT